MESILGANLYKSSLRHFPWVTTEYRFDCISGDSGSSTWLFHITTIDVNSLQAETHNRLRALSIVLNATGPISVAIIIMAWTIFKLWQIHWWLYFCLLSSQDGHLTNSLRFKKLWRSNRAAISWMQWDFFSIIIMVIAILSRGIPIWSNIQHKYIIYQENVNYYEWR